MENAHLTDRFYELSVKKLSSEISRPELKELDNFLKDTKTLKAYLEIEKSWNEIEVITDNGFDADKAYIKLEQRIDEWQFKQNKFSFIRIAASIALLIGLGISGWLGYDQFFSNQMELVKTANGERNTVYLADGTLIELNANSSIEYSSNFGNEREIKLKGEAYFKVAKDKSRPFKVSSNGITTTVLGTQFNIKSYDEDSLIAVSLLEGSIKVESNTNSAILKPLQQVIVDKKANDFTVAVFDSVTAVAWLSNTLIFHNTSMKQIALELKRIYGLEIIFSNPELAELSISGRFRNENLTLVLMAITKANKLEFRKINEQKIEIYKPDLSKKEEPM